VGTGGGEAATSAEFKAEITQEGWSRVKAQAHWQVNDYSTTSNGKQKRISGSQYYVKQC
jgi:hypothetical protein